MLWLLCHVPFWLHLLSLCFLSPFLHSKFCFNASKPQENSQEWPFIGLTLSHTHVTTATGVAAFRAPVCPLGSRPRPGAGQL